MRPEVRDFAEAMEDKLRINDSKGGWLECDLTYLKERLEDEVGELLRADTDEDICDECCDVANFAMMIYDRSKET